MQRVLLQQICNLQSKICNVFACMQRIRLRQAKCRNLVEASHPLEVAS